ncbi:MAG: hypothetical protein AW12_01250 [Candidatus Accumulibacter sp. BA-94]|nr:MAG: hypothetical protein AW12_01250 [Candidatus Accumulibacter sp. BA-94]
MCTPGVVFGIGVDEQHLSAPACRLAVGLRTQHQDAGGDGGAVEQVLRQADDGLDQILIDPLLANLLFLAAPEQHSVGHHGRHHAGRLAHRQHVLGEHQVALLAGGRAPAPAEALGEFHVGAGVVLAEGRIGDHPVEALQLAGLAVQRVQQGVLALDVGVGDAVQNHVEFADGPGGHIQHLSGQAHIGAVATALLHIFLGQDEHAAGPAGWVIHAHPLLRFEQPHHQTHDVTRRVEVTALLARRFGEHVDQEFVCSAE